MIHFFTDPYKDELIYSAIARYHYYTGNMDCKDTLEELFGKRSIIASLEIGSYIDILARNLGGRYKAENIISKYTIFPFYNPFLPDDRKKELLEKIKYDDGSGIYTKLGMVAGSICKKRGIYYCPCCANKEIEEYGETYIHREHQLQGVFICPNDGTELKKYPVDRTNSSRIEFIRLDNKLLDLRNVRGIDNMQYDKLYKLSKDAYYLLQTDLYDISKEKVLEKYKNMLYEKGLTTTSKRIKQRELYEEFISFYGKEFLALMESSIDNNDEYNWLRVITRNLSRTVHPIRHLLLINFLETDIDSFFKDIKVIFNPFGKGPWPCLNRASEHYRRNVVKSLEITEDYKTRVPVGTFTCECGFVYSRKGPDKTETDKYKIGRIKSFGSVWEDKLKQYLKEGKYGLRELARLMNCDPKTILKFDFILEINMFENNSRYIKDKKATTGSDKLSDYKNCILGNMASNPTATRTEIRSMCKKEYIFIYRKDKKWLYNKLPIETKRINHNALLDWNKRDIELLFIVKNRHEELMDSDEPIRITKSSIGREILILTTLEKNIIKLPNTEKYLNEIIETVEDFQIRRCKKIINNKIAKGEPIKIWEIQRIAGIRSEAFGKIKAIILRYIDS
ncbi:TnsD family Tn7-like transposition protein [Clostridium gasigenes]|uniref:TniQ family protein n=1 Tax=Clostridium gasigenes TaxID=94869 RepID=A0A7X0SDB1_9CLOT|nr:TnsD family Tn7-like transposition protein [Clostridium gasigenes]MBB6715375.1 TniQ family protein [Clostridium gasigenes]